MSTLEIILNLAFLGLLVVATVIGWKLIARLEKFNATAPELKKTLNSLNAAILHAEGTIRSLNKMAGLSSDTEKSDIPLNAHQPKIPAVRANRTPRLTALIQAAAATTQERP